MKIVLSLLLLVSTVACAGTNRKIASDAPAVDAPAADAPRFSAFTDKFNLYVTLLGDCNKYTGRLLVPVECKSDRGNKDLVLDCTVDLQVITTKMGCYPGKKSPKVMEISLKDANMASEVEELTLKYRDQKITVGVNH